MTMQIEMVRRLPGAALLLTLALTSTAALAETDRITVEDPATSTVKFKVTSDGNVSAAKVFPSQIGVNTLTPASQIEVAAENGPNSEVRLRVASTGSGAPFFFGSRANGTLAAPLPTGSGKALFGLGSTGYATSGWTSALSGLIGFYTTETWTDTSTGTDIRFATTAKGSATRAERVRIADNGNLGIGTTAPAQALEVNGGVRMNTLLAKPACTSLIRGTFWLTQKGAGEADLLEVCMKNASEAYVWRGI
jgi:hypothetical protein